MPFCEEVSVCPRCGGMQASESAVMEDIDSHCAVAVDSFMRTHLVERAKRRREEEEEDEEDEEDEEEEEEEEDEDDEEDGSTVLHEDLAEVRCIIESSDRRDERKRRLMTRIINQCRDDGIKDWMKEYFQDYVVFPLVDMYYFLIRKLKEKKKKKKKKEKKEIDIIFVAHGEIDSFMFPPDFLMPLDSIKDVVLYSPWNCAINADVAYGVATGSIQPHHRRFSCMSQGCPHPDYVHQPTNLPDDWNSLRAAGGSKIPNILLSPLKTPQDPAWNRVVFLQDILGKPGRNRVLIPLTRQRWTGSNKKIPFLVVTLVLSLVLKAFGYRATVHLAACLNRSEGATLDVAKLMEQYGLTIDNTVMGSSEERIRELDNDPMYQFFKDMFG